MSEQTAAPLRLVLSSVLVAVVDSPTRPLLLSVVGRTPRPATAPVPADSTVVAMPRRPLEDGPDGPSAA